jgi:Bacterial PH domain
MADPLPSPLVFRSRRLMLLASVASAALLGLCLFGWFALPVNLRDQFTLSQIVTLLGILAGLIFAMLVLASSNVRVDADGLRIRNGLARHQVSWDQVHKFLLRPGDPWAVVLIKPDDRPFEVDLDAEKRQLMGILRSDGAAAVDAVATLRQWHHQRSPS